MQPTVFEESHEKSRKSSSLSRCLKARFLRHKHINGEVASRQLGLLRINFLQLDFFSLLLLQATLGGKMKGKSIQYHSNISKEEGRLFYEKFVSLCEVLTTVIDR